MAKKQGFSIRLKGIDQIDDTINQARDKASLTLTTQVMKDTVPYVPMESGNLFKEARIEDNTQIVYPGPYARYLYYGKVMVGPKYGPKMATDKDLVFSTKRHKKAQAFWFEASKAQNLEKWERVAGKALKHYLDEDRGKNNK